MHNQATLNIVLLRVFFESQNKVLKASRTHRKDTMQSNGCGTYSLILFTSESEKRCVARTEIFPNIQKRIYKLIISCTSYDLILLSPPSTCYTIVKKP